MVSYELSRGLINIDLFSDSAYDAQRTLVMVIASLLDEMRKPQKTSVDNATRFLGNELNRLRTELEEAEGKVSKFKQEHAGELQDFEQANLDSYLSYQRALMDAEIRLQNARSRRSVLEERLRGFKRAELLPDQQAAHKTVLKEIKSLASNVGLLRKKISASKNSVKASAKNEKILTSLLRDIDIKTKVYRSLLEKHEDSQVTRALAMREEGDKVWVLQAPTLAIGATGPRRIVILFGSGVAGVFLGLFLVLVVEFMNGTFRRELDLQQATDLPLLGTLPKIKN
jgi:uncharacterized protein involved in exopolysaccharide biosynthesis